MYSKVVCEEFMSIISMLWRRMAQNKILVYMHPYRWMTIGKELSHVENAIL